MVDLWNKDNNETKIKGWRLYSYYLNPKVKFNQFYFWVFPCNIGTKEN
jgi:hypothetical protein